LDAQALVDSIPALIHIAKWNRLVDSFHWPGYFCLRRPRENTVQNFPGKKMLAFALTFLVSILGVKSSSAQVAPAITTQPANQTVTEGQAATFSVVISNGPCRSFWYINGAGYFGSVGSTISYTIPNTTLAMNGWTVSVDLYSCGSTGANLGNSQTAILTVNSATGAPTITAQPANQTVTAGQTATFSLVATGTAPLSYQWQKNGSPISGAAAASYTTPATSTSDSGAAFKVVVTNSAGSATSNSATLTVNTAQVAPSITTQPANQTVTAGQTATFSVVATGTAPLSYQWQKNGSAISGATAVSYTTPAATSSDNGAIFQATVSNSIGGVTSNSATLTVSSGSGPTITLTLANTHQTMSGFGASVAFQDGNPWSTSETDMLYCQSPFSGPSCAQNGIGLSLLRTMIYEDGTYPFVSQMQAARARGATIWLAPWTAPAAWKTSGSLNFGYLCDGTSGCGNVNHYQDWATYLSNYVSTLENTYGIPIYALSVQNEPDFSNGTYRAMLWTAAEFDNFIKNYLGPTLAANNPGLKIIMPEESHWQMELAATCQSDPNCSKYVSIIAAHGFAEAYPSPLTVNVGQEVWETEDSDLGTNDSSWSNGLGWAQQIHRYLATANVNSWHYGWGVDEGDGNGQGLITAGTAEKRMWALGNWSNFVKPGWIRTDVSCSGSACAGFLLSAFKNPANGAFAIVVINTTSSSQTFTFNGVPSGVATVTPYVTSASQNLAAASPIGVNLGSFGATVAGSSVTSFVNP
jgi:O-glycosyl hydrolase